MDPTGKYANSPNAAWFSRQYNSQHGYCCTMADAHLYYGPYDVQADGSVTIPLVNGTKRSVESGKGLEFNPDDPNPTGTAVWWYSSITEAGTYCFALGSLG